MNTKTRESRIEPARDEDPSELATDDADREDDDSPTGDEPEPAPAEAADPDDEALDDAARGLNATSDESPDGTGEIDAIGDAAGLVVDDDDPIPGIDQIERRDEHRWELDPDSADADPLAR